MKRYSSLLLLLVLLSALFPASLVGAGGAIRQAESRLRVDMDAFSLINEVNALRAANGLAPYSINPILMAIAQQHAEFMAAYGVSHYGYSGTRPYQRALNAGYPLAGDLSLGGFMSENITAGSEKSVQQAVLEWQGDAPHLNTMLSPNLTEIGAGVAIVDGRVYYVIDCAKPTGSGVPQNTPLPSAGGATAVPGAASSPLPAVVRTIVPSTPGADGKVYHEVNPGETLWLIAISYGVKVADLQRLNGLGNSLDIYPKMKLLVMEMPTPTPTGTVTPTLFPTFTPYPTFTAQPTPTATPTPVVVVASNSSRTVLWVILVAALVLAGVITVGMRDTK